MATNPPDLVALPDPAATGASVAAAAPTGPVVQLNDVSVVYGGNQALRSVTAAFARGAVGLLGPNGAGKSTMLKALLGFVKPTSGRMTVLGMDVAERPMDIRARLGYMPESDSHIPGMNAVSFVAYCGQLAGLPAVDAMQRAHEVLYYVGLGEARYRNVETYSTGMKQRIKLAQALVHDPDLLFLDEPTNGMDPKGRDEMLELIRDLGHNKNVSLILSSHLLPDVEFTCDDVIVMDKGRVAAQGPIEELKGPAGRVFELRIKGDLPAFIDVLKRQAWTACHRRGRDAGLRARGLAARHGPLAISRPSSPRRRGTASRCGTCGRASRRSRTSSRKRWARSRCHARSTTRATGATAACARARGGPGPSLPPPASAPCCASARSSGCCSSPGRRSSAA